MYALVTVMRVAPLGTVQLAATHVMVSPSISTSPSRTCSGVTTVPWITVLDGSVPTSTVVAAHAGGARQAPSRQREEIHRARARLRSDGSSAHHTRPVPRRIDAS